MKIKDVENCDVKVKEVTYYETSDGAVFGDKLSAEFHEKLINKDNLVEYMFNVEADRKCCLTVFIKSDKGPQDAVKRLEKEIYGNYHSYAWYWTDFKITKITEKETN